jgi:hypothetical protein
MQTKIVKTVAIGTVVSIALASVAFAPAAEAAPVLRTSTGRITQIHPNTHFATLPEPISEQVRRTRM